MSHELHPLDRVTPDRIQDRIAALLAEELGVERGSIDVHRPFTHYGLDSMSAVILAGDLEDWLGIEVPSTVAWDHPTVSDLSRFLAAAVAAPAACFTATRLAA